MESSDDNVVRNKRVCFDTWWHARKTTFLVHHVTSIECKKRIPKPYFVLYLDTMADFVVPGQPITSETGYLRGHGAYIKSADNDETNEGGASTGMAGVLISSVAGRIVRVNKLISVKPLRSRYASILLVCFPTSFIDMIPLHSDTPVKLVTLLSDESRQWIQNGGG